MANKRISELTAYTTPISGDVLPINDTTNTTTKKVTVDNFFNILSSLFRIKDSTDPTKKVAFDVSGVTTATTRTLTVPNANTTIVGTDTTQTLTNKTLTSPKITVGSDAAGDLQYTSNADGTQSRLAIGPNTYVLRSNGSAPTWSPETTNADATSTVAGIVELATAAEITAGTATGGTGAALAITPDALAASTPSFNGSNVTNVNLFNGTVYNNIAQGAIGFTTGTLNTNTTFYCSRFLIPHRIVVNKVSFNVTAVGTSGTVIVSCFSEDGGTRPFSVTTATISGSGVVTTSVSSVALTPGYYYIGITPVSTTSITVSTFSVGGLNTVSSEPGLCGEITGLTASTAPSTINPNNVLTNSTAPQFRLDN